MPETTRQPDLESKEFPYVIKYFCQCGNEITYFDKKKPKILTKCYYCLPEMPKGD